MRVNCSRTGPPWAAKPYKPENGRARLCGESPPCARKGPDTRSDRAHFFYNGGNAFCSSCWTCAGNQCPDNGAFGSAPVALLLLRGLPPYVGSHIRSKPLPSSFGMNSLEPSDSPGGLIHTYASMPDAGAARGRSPIPAPDGLHQLPLWMRRSMREALMRALRSG